jgi:uncharacterized protein (TIGR03067 family)
MKKIVPVVLALAVTVGWPAAADDTRKSIVAKELKRLEGTWQAVASEKDGRKAPAAVVKSLKFIIAGSKYTIQKDGKTTEEGTFQIDPSAKPRKLTVTPTKPAGKVQRGIYELKGDDTLRICFTHPGTAYKRPTRFSTTKGTGHVLTVVKRVKAE